MYNFTIYNTTNTTHTTYITSNNDNDTDTDNNSISVIQETLVTSELPDLLVLPNLPISPDIKIITVRGIKCISTIPSELVWGKKGRCLECNNCLKNAIDPISKVLIGLCYICAEHYDYKYGCGYFENLDGYEAIPSSFGGLNTKDVIDKVQELTNHKIEQYQIANNLYHSWSIYDMTIRLSNNDINLLTKKNNYGWQEFYKHYAIDYNYGLEKDLDDLINIVCSLQKYYEITDDEGNIITKKVDSLLFNKEFYDDCNDYQLAFPENKIILSDYSQSTNLYKYNCEYCKICKPKKQLQKCSRCYIAKYCSIACQTRDWKIKHKNTCYGIEKKGEDVD